jgi:hypothetical protein
MFNRPTAHGISDSPDRLTNLDIRWMASDTASRRFGGSCISSTSNKKGNRSPKLGGRSKL